MKGLKHTVVNDDSVILLLGSFPGEESLKERRYYANIGNRFWIVLSKLTGKENPNLLKTKEEKDSAQNSILEKTGIVLWDMYYSCKRVDKKGKATSSDSDIQDVKWNNIYKFLKENKQIKWIAVAGQDNYRLFKNNYEYYNRIAKMGIFTLMMPSSSPQVPQDKIEREWTALLKSIGVLCEE